MKTATLDEVRTHIQKGDFSVRTETEGDDTAAEYGAVMNTLLEKCDSFKRRSDLTFLQNPMPILIFGTDWKIMVANEAYAKMSGMPREKLKGMSAKEFKILEQKGEGLKLALQERKRSFGEVTVRMPSGTKILEQYGIPILDESNEVKSLFVVYNDVTVQREEEKKIRSLIETNPMPLAVVDSNFRMLDVNPAYETLVRQKRDDLLKGIPPNYKIKFVRGDKTDVTFKENRSTKCELAFTFADGTRKIVEQSGVPLTLKEEKVESAFFVFNDVTEQREEEKKIRSLIETNPMPLAVVDSNFRMLDVNPAYETLVRQKRDDLLKGIPPNYKIKFVSGDKTDVTFMQNRSTKCELAFTFPDGTRKVVEQYGVPLTIKNEKVESAFFVFNEITALRKEMEESAALQKRISTSVDELGASLAALAAGDMTRPAPTYPDDPLAKVKADLNGTISSLGTILSEIHSMASRLEVAIMDVGRSAEEIAKASQSVATTSQKVSTDMKSQLSQIEHVMGEVSDLSSSIEEIASTSQEVRTLTTNVTKAGNAAAALGKDANSRMKAVEEISQSAVSEITKLHSQIQEISAIVKLITDIANQTNLLALNAAIEAARAGEHGRGFAVVAGEVRNLAGESKGATRNIDEVITRITKSSEATVDAMKRAYSEIVSGITSVNETIGSLDRIAADLNITSKSVEDISRATETQAVATNNVTKNVDQINSLMLNGEKSMEDLAALAEEASASTEEVASASSEIKNLAVQMREMVGRFRVQ
jgi:methyl-accepting chemotaxis protein